MLNSVASKSIFNFVKKMIVFAPAKINIGLYVIEKRTDGYHNIETIMYPIPLFDVIEILDNPNFYIRHYGIPYEDQITKHTCYKAWSVLHEHFNISPVRINILKNIPIQSGLGGGSSDGAAVLLSLIKKFRLTVDQETLHEMSLSIGSDCPFFLQTSPCYVTGRGEQLEPIDITLNGLYLTLIKPPFGMKTEEAYKMCRPAPHGKLKEHIRQPIETWKNNITNVFQETFLKNYPAVNDIFNKVFDSHPLYVSLTGTGSCFYCISRDPFDISFIPENWFVRQIILTEHVEANS